MNAPRETAPDLRTRFSLSLKEAATAFGISEGLLRQLLPEIPHVYLAGAS